MKHPTNLSVALDKRNPQRSTKLNRGQATEGEYATGVSNSLDNRRIISLKVGSNAGDSDDEAEGSELQSESDEQHGESSHSGH